MQAKRADKISRMTVSPPAASARFDPQAKGLGEWVRSRFVHVQEGLL